MSASKVIKQIMVEMDISVKDLPTKLDMKPQVFSNKLYRDTFTYDDYVKIASILGCTVQTSCFPVLCCILAFPFGTPVYFRLTCFVVIL